MLIFSFGTTQTYSAEGVGPFALPLRRTRAAATPPKRNKAAFSWWATRQPGGPVALQGGAHPQGLAARTLCCGIYKGSNQP